MERTLAPSAYAAQSRAPPTRFQAGSASPHTHMDMDIGSPLAGGALAAEQLALEGARQAQLAHSSLKSERERQRRAQHAHALQGGASQAERVRLSKPAPVHAPRPADVSQVYGVFGGVKRSERTHSGGTSEW